MAFRAHHTNKKTGVTYVYEAVSYWDKEKKQPRNKQVCVGKLDPDTGEFIPSKRLKPEQAAARDPDVTATTKVIGPSLLLDKCVEKTGLKKVLKQSFPEHYLKILSLAYYLAASGGPLCHCESWSKSHAHPYVKSLTSQRISEFLRVLRTDGIHDFFRDWALKISENDYLCYDITSISSYSRLNEYVKYGYNRDKEKLPQVNMALLTGQKSELPVYFRQLPGSITDVDTLRYFLKTTRYLGTPRLHLVLDKGFYSKRNIDALLAERCKFTMALPIKPKWLKVAIDDVRDTIQLPDGYRKVDKEVLYVHTRLMPWGKKNKRCYLHLYYNSHIAATVTDGFTEKLMKYREELENNDPVPGHEAAYEAYFHVKTTPVRGRKVRYNNEAIQKARNSYSGFCGILTNDIKDPVAALRMYRDRDRVEKSFNDMKNSLDMRRLRIHSSEAMEGRFFIQFIALIIKSAIRHEMRSTKLIEKYTVPELLGEMATLNRIKFGGKYGSILTEATKAQRHIMETLGIPLPT